MLTNKIEIERQRIEQMILQLQEAPHKYVNAPIAYLMSILQEQMEALPKPVVLSEASKKKLDASMAKLSNPET